jgi:hypothetical protein
MVPDVTRQVFAAPFNTRGNVSCCGLTQAAGLLLAIAFGVAEAACALPVAITRPNNAPTRNCIDLQTLCPAFMVPTFMLVCLE